MRYVFDLTIKGCCTLYSNCHIELFIYSNGTSNSLVYALDNRIGCPSKLVSTLSKTKCLCLLFRFYTTVLYVPQQRVSVFRLNQNEQKNNQNSLIESTVCYFFRKILGCVGLFQNNLFQLFRFYTKTESFDVLIEPKQTEDQLKQFDREHILVFFRKI